MVQNFPTKVDGWLVAVGALALALAFWAGWSAHSPQPPNLWLAAARALAWAAVPVLLVAIVAFPTRYELHSDELVIRSGVLRYRIPYADLRGAEPTRSLFSAPAWSLDRLHLSRTGGSDMVISPHDKDGFLQELQRRAPHLRHVGDRLVPNDA